MGVLKLHVYGINSLLMSLVQGTCGNGSDLYQDYFRKTVLLTNIGPQNMVMFIVQIHQLKKKIFWMCCIKLGPQSYDQSVSPF